MEQELHPEGRNSNKESIFSFIEDVFFRRFSSKPLLIKSFDFYLISLINVFQLRNDEYSTDQSLNCLMFVQFSSTYLLLCNK